MGKASLWRIPVDHFRTLYDNRTRKPDWLAIAVQSLVPLATGLGTWILGAKLTNVEAAVAGISIVAGLLFSMAVFLFQLRTSLGADKRLVADDYKLVDECMSNTLWAILWGLALALFLIVAGGGGWIGAEGSGPILTGIAVAAATHFLLVIGMCLKRLRRAYERIAIGRK
ncbi:hypothetical protein [Microbacterium sp. NIBRBAC000506063]|uniref:hypothetical protein n=1 Tax=Microbacterium sp. NIBRBAC000506063 TaxID=2734618 RepID=UPI001BB58099|nr:hypothetical protein [Microbacterium sp. NIBRBAC000506063]QTV80771.1 hypothetical protein KAE78_15065 [Microbacterium sp. NIBRBAC000506063]